MERLTAARIVLTMHSHEAEAPKINGVQSAAVWMLRIAGVPDGEGNLHPRAEPEKFAYFRHDLKRWEEGHEFSEAEKDSFAHRSTEVFARVMELADVVVMTLSNCFDSNCPRRRGWQSTRARCLRSRSRHS
jgi:hypothetical protein